MATEIQTSEQNTPELPRAIRAARPDFMEQEFKDFASRVKTKVGDGPPEPVKNAKLEKDSPELEQWNKTGEVKPKETEPKEATEATPAAEGKSPKSEETDEPHPDDRIWNKGLEGKELEAHHRRVETQAQSAVEHIANHAKRQDIQAGLQNIFKGRDAQCSDFLGALSEIKNPGEVLAHIGLSKTDRDILLSLPTWQAMRKAVHQVSAALLPKPKPTPRAPKPPSEVGGRGTAPPDDEGEAIRSNDFRRASAAWDRRYFGKG